MMVSNVVMRPKKIDEAYKETEALKAKKLSDIHKEEKKKEEKKQEPCDMCKETKDSSFQDICRFTMDVGALGEYEVDTFVSLGKDPMIITEFYGSDNEATIYLQRHSTRRINFCPFCGRRLREE